MSTPAMPWAKYAAQPAEGGDAKPWEKYAQTNPPPPPDERNGAQRFMDNLTTVTPEQDAKTPGILKPLAHFGAGAIEGATSPFVHPLQTLEGVGKSASALFGNDDDMHDIINGVKSDPAKALGNVVGGADLGGVAAEAGAPVMARIPTRAKAGALFENVMQDAGDQPVKLTRAMEPLERAQQLSARGGGTVGAVDNLYKRINTINPLDYREARDWASNLSRLTAQDSMSSSPALKAQVGKLSHAFNEDIGDTAASVGRGEDYAKAMRDYRRASMFNNAAKTTAKWAIPAAVGGGLAGTALKKVMQ